MTYRNNHTTTPKRALTKKSTRVIMEEARAQMGSALALTGNVAYFPWGSYLATEWYPATTCPTEVGLYQGLVNTVVSTNGKTSVVSSKILLRATKRKPVDTVDTSAHYQTIRNFLWDGVRWVTAEGKYLPVGVGIVWRAHKVTTNVGLYTADEFYATPPQSKKPSKSTATAATTATKRSAKRW